MSKPGCTVSIIMNCYNCARFLREAIDSVYSQTYLDWEIIFWDNASTDKSKEIARSYDSRLKYHCAQETTPLGEARNLAMQKAVGKYITFLDCDDLYFPEKLEKQVKLMDQGQYAMSYSGAIVIDEQGHQIRRAPAKNKSGYLFERLLNKYEINMQSVMLRRSYLNANEMSFSTRFQYCPDYNLFMDIASQNEVGVLNEYLVKYRMVKGSLSRRTLHLVSDEVRYTLDYILKREPGLREKYPAAIKAAYGKLHYYDAINMISQSKYREARSVLKAVVMQRWQYMALYFVLFIPLPSEYILRFLRR